MRYAPCSVRRLSMLDFYAPIQVKLLSLNSLFKAESYFPTLLFYEFIAIYAAFYGDKKIRR
jgi:hypothetical protein